MSREIKFRVWDTLRKNWCDYFSVDIVSWTPTGEEETEFVYQQYVGMKDSQGKDIYEGDIVEWKADVGEFVSRYVRQEDEIYWDTNRDGFMIRYKDEYGYNSYEVLSQFIQFTVIGNIYETPKLGTSDAKSCENKSKKSKRR